MWVALLAAATCLPCHEEFVRSYAKTGMGRSISKPTAELQLRQEGAHGSARWVASWTGKQLAHAVNDEVRTMDWAVGSGREGKSFLLRLGDALFQSPLSWYARRRAWDLSPGFNRDRRLNFLRPVTADCLSCHAGESVPIAGTLNRYAADPLPAPAITCERCHGDASAHIKSPLRANIVNPRRLPPVARDSVCEQCHLGGTARVLNPGKTWADFRPGLALETVFSVYVPKVPADPNRIKVVSHSEQLALSRCKVASGNRLWCATCHDPHREPEEAFTEQQAKCQSCHQTTKPHGDACTTCHMPRTESSDGGHTAYTDHRIRKPGAPKVLLERSEELQAWRPQPDPALQARGLGLAYAGAGRLEKAFDLLRGLANPDAAVQDALGLIYLRAERPGPAVLALSAAVKADPRNSVRRLNLAAAYWAAGETEKARTEAMEAITLEPLLEDAYALLAEMEPRRAEYWRGEFLKRLR
jgi:hypothetical protein